MTALIGGSVQPPADQPYIEAHRSGDIVWIDMMVVPKGRRGTGAGRAFYDAWVAALPQDIPLIRLMAADTGAGLSNGFWEAMGFSYVYVGDDLDYELGQQMWQGVNGHPTPPSIEVEPAEDDGYAP